MICQEFKTVLGTKRPTPGHTPTGSVAFTSAIKLFNHLFILLNQLLEGGINIFFTVNMNLFSSIKQIHCSDTFFLSNHSIEFCNWTKRRSRMAYMGIENFGEG